MPFVELTAKPLPEKIFKTESNGISRKTHEEHFKLYTGYVNKTNEVRKAIAALTDEDFAAANQSYSKIRSLKTDLTFALGGVYNHELYFEILGGGGGPAAGPVAQLISRDFGSFEKYSQDLKATGIAARGWVWTAVNQATGELFNYLGDAQNTFPVWGATPVLALDTYEHAYYLDFATGRAGYIDAFLKSIDWDAVNQRLAKAPGR
jgi:Fe-Mn family superoxide dismutase